MRNGDWFTTYTGKKFYPVDPHPDDICIWDIAHALARICRFGGHVQEFYSVAQHSVLVSDDCSSAPLQALLHDATEAYVGDVVRPLKYALPDYIVIEERVWEAVCEKFGMQKLMHPHVKISDNKALMTERRDLLTPTDHVWSLDGKVKPFDQKIIPMSPVQAESLFMQRFKQLTGN